jgi:hypothetical protein
VSVAEVNHRQLFVLKLLILYYSTYYEYFEERSNQFEKSDFNVDPTLLVAHEQNCILIA